jgi:hypothetical protein
VKRGLCCVLFPVACLFDWPDWKKPTKIMWTIIYHSKKFLIEVCLAFD